MNDSSDRPDVPPAVDPPSPPAAPQPDAAPASSSAGPVDPPTVPTRKKWIAAFFAAVGIALFVSAMLRGPDSNAAGTGHPADGKTCAASRGPAKFDFTLKDMNGADVRLSDYKGKVVLLNFWATWCSPCKVEIPEFVEAYSHYRDRGFVILGVLSQDDPSSDDLRAFTSKYAMNYPVLRQSEPLEDAFGGLWALPTSFIIDRHGSICTKHMGAVSREMLEREIKGLL